jgi:hypothetical protein
MAKNILRIFIILAVIICAVLVFRYPKELKNAADRIFSSTNNVYDRIFKKKGEVSAIGASTTATTVATTVATSTNTTTSDATATSVVIETSPATTTNATATDGNLTDSIAFNSAINQSRILWASGKYAESLAMAQVSLQKAQNNEEKAKAQYWIGLSYYSQGNREEAEKAELLAIEIYPDYEPPYTTLSAIKFDENECNLSLTFAQEALQLNQNDYWALNNLGLSYLCLGDKENAVIQLEKAFSLAPNINVILNNLNIALASLGG